MTTLVVETGSGSLIANCYISRADADTYFDERGLTDWAGASASARNAAILRGAQYIENGYRGRWKGARTSRTQAMAWPRVESVSWGSVGLIEDEDGWYIESNEIPDQLVSANAEAAYLVILGVELEPRLARGGAIKSKMVKAGPVETSTTYTDSALVVDRLTAIEGYLRGLIIGTPGASFGSTPFKRS